MYLYAKKNYNIAFLNKSIFCSSLIKGLQFTELIFVFQFTQF